MKKILRVKNLDCPHCAMKLERAFNKAPEIDSASVDFLTQKIILEAEEDCMDQALSQVRAVIRRLEPEVELV